MIDLYIRVRWTCYERCSILCSLPAGQVVHSNVDTLSPIVATLATNPSTRGPSRIQPMKLVVSGVKAMSRLFTVRLGVVILCGVSIDSQVPSDKNNNRS